MSYKGYKFRAYPNSKQMELINKNIDGCNFVYNKCLEHLKEERHNGNKDFRRNEYQKYLTHVLKPDNPWLSELDSTALFETVSYLNDAMTRYFQGTNGFPKFKSKNRKLTKYRTILRTKNTIDLETGYVWLPKIGKVKINVTRKFSSKVIYAYVEHTKSDKYFVSLVVKQDDNPYKDLDLNNSVGIDLGLKELVVTSDFEIFELPDKINTLLYQIDLYHSRLDRKKYGSKNYEKERIKLNKCYDKLKNVKQNYLHMLTTKLVNEYDYIFSEDIDIEDLKSNHGLARLMETYSWGEICRQLDYKTGWNGKVYQKVDQYFPSTQLCSNCGFKNTKLKNTHIREWICPECGTVHHRDINSAINILHEGKRITLSRETTPRNKSD